MLAVTRRNARLAGTIFGTDSVRRWVVGRALSFPSDSEKSLATIRRMLCSILAQRQGLHFQHLIIRAFG